MPFRPCVSGCGRYLAPGDGHDRCLSCLGIEHAEAAFVDESCPHCGGMTVAGLRTRLRFLQRGGVPVPLPRSRVPPGGYRGEATSGSSRAGLTVTVRNSPKTARAPPVTGTSLPMELPRERAGPSHGGGVPLVSFGAPPDDRMSIATLEGESDQSGDDGSVPLPPSGRSAVPDSDPEMVAMLARAAESVGLEWRPPPCPEPSRLDDWFLGVARAGSQGPTPVPFFPEVHDELTGTWTAPFTARNRSSGSSSLATLDGGAARGYTEVPPVERSVAMQLCPRTASTWRGNPLLPSRACRHSSALTGSAYAACGEAASALHAMALLQVHQAKALRDLHEGGHDPGVLSELRTATDLGQLGKEQTLPGAEDLFSRYGVRLGQSDSAPHTGTRSVGVELLEYIQEQDGGTTETVSEAPGAYGGCGGGHAAGAAPYETASTLAPWPSPEVGVAERHAEGPSHSSLPPNLHPVVRPFIPSGRSAPGTGLQASCGLHRRLRQGLGGHVQRACSVRGLDGSPTALAHQLPRVAGSTPGLEPSQETLTRRACTSPYGQHGDRCVHQPTRWSTLPSHVTTRPPPPPLESEASEVASRHSYPGLAQPDSRRAVTSCAPRRMETPSPDGPADLATFWTCTGRPVRVPRDVALPVVLLPDRWNTRHGRTGTQLAAGPSQICISPSEPSRTDSVQGQRGRGADPARGTILAYQDLVPRADASRDSPSLADSSEEGSTDSETGHLMAPASRSLETSCLVPRRDAEVLGDLPQEVVDTITSARAPSTRHAYALKWNLFVEWCSSHREDPRRCPIRVVLSFLQQGLERRLSPSTLKVYVAAIAAKHDPVEGKSKKTTYDVDHILPLSM